MGRSFTVTPEELDKVSRELKQNSEMYTDIYKKLLNKTQTMGDAWQGEDNLKFVERINGFCQELEAMASKLMVASEVLQKQADNYRRQQQENIAIIGKLQN